MIDVSSEDTHEIVGIAKVALTGAGPPALVLVAKREGRVRGVEDEGSVDDELLGTHAGTEAEEPARGSGISTGKQDCESEDSDS